MRAHSEEEPCMPIWYTDVRACSPHAHTPQGQGGQGCPGPSIRTPMTNTHILTGLQTHGSRELSSWGSQDPHAMQAEVRLYLGLGP